MKNQWEIFLRRLRVSKFFIFRKIKKIDKKALLVCFSVSVIIYLLVLKMTSNDDLGIFDKAFILLGLFILSVYTILLYLSFVCFKDSLKVKKELVELKNKNYLIEKE